MAEREHDVASPLIAALAAEAVHVDDGSFTFDPAAAFTKLRSHQLDDPHRYVLLLVEAAWLAAEALDGAELRVELGAASLAGSASVFDFHGLPLERGSLQHLFAAALGGTGKLQGDALRRARVLQLLGLAANNALALQPKRLILESSDADGHRERLCIEPTARSRSSRQKAIGARLGSLHVLRADALQRPAHARAGAARSSLSLHPAGDPCRRPPDLAAHRCRRRSWHRCAHGQADHCADHPRWPADRRHRPAPKSVRVDEHVDRQPRRGDRRPELRNPRLAGGDRARLPLDLSRKQLL